MHSESMQHITHSDIIRFFEDIPEAPIQPVLWPDFSVYGLQVQIKREDLLHPYISGNKWRKLKYVMADAVAKNKTHLVSFGGAYSNHLLALAFAANKLHLQSSACVRGEVVQNPVLDFCKQHRMHLHFISRTEYRNKQAAYESLFAPHIDTYFIDEGGRGELAVKGCEEIMSDVSGYTHYVCAAGTGTTLAGIARSAKRNQAIAEGICVLKGAQAMNDEVNEWAGYEVLIHHDFHRGGYAKTDNELLAFVAEFYQKNNIRLDEVYTAKAMMAICELAKQNYYPKGSNILFVHTGGVSLLTNPLSAVD